MASSRERYWPVVFALVLYGLLSACSLSDDAEPNIPDHTLVEIIAEMHIVTARAERYGPLSSSIRDSILARHGLDSTRFAAVLGYYADHPDDYLKIYMEVLNRLNELWDLRQMPYQPLPDSLRALIQ